MNDDSSSIPFATVSHKPLLVAGVAVVVQPPFEGLKIYLQKIDEGKIWCKLLTFFLMAHSLLLSLLLGGNLFMLSAMFWMMVCFLALSAATHSLRLFSRIFTLSSCRLGVWSPESGESSRGLGLAVLEWSMGQLLRRWDFNKQTSSKEVCWPRLPLCSDSHVILNPSHVNHGHLPCGFYKVPQQSRLDLVLIEV